MAAFPKVLLVDDDRNITGVLNEALKSSYDLEIASSGKQAIYKCDIYNFDIILLDLTLPDISGESLCQILKERGLNAPILILTANKNILKKIELLDNGASDYLSKPFSLGELKARIRVLLRTKANIITPNFKPINSCGVSLDKKRHIIIRDGVSINLRRKEIALLEYLMLHEGLVVSRDELIGAVWPNSEDMWTNTLDVHIKYLRDKIDRPFKSSLITTVHGQGYKFGDNSLITKLHYEKTN